MFSNLKKSVFLITLLGTIAMQDNKVMAAEEPALPLVPEIGIEMLIPGIPDEWVLEPELTTEDKGEYSDIAFTDVTSFLYIRSEPTKESEYVGKLYSGASMEITGVIGEWTPVQSGEVSGYVKTEYIVFGTEAEQRAEQMILSGEEFQFAESRIAEEERMQNLGQEVVSFACQFIGNPYVWGGTSLTNGADCSGFVQSVFANFGVSLPRTSFQQRSAGVGVPYEEARAGDLVCYDGHVGIYMGDGKIVNAMSPSEGIGISPATYTTILSVRRVV